MTTHEAETIAVNVDRVDKRKPFILDNPRIDTDGRGLVDIYTTGSMKTVKSYFKKAGATVTGYWRIRGGGLVVMFDWR